MAFATIGGGVRIFYRDEGRARAGRAPILFLHGFTGGSWYWSGLVRRFSKERRAVSLDWKGHGESDKPIESVYSVAQYASELDEFCARLGLEEAVLCGHSMGGMIAELYALDRAGRGGRLKIRALVLCATAARLTLSPMMLKGYETLVAFKDQWPRETRLQLARLPYHPDYADAHPEVVEEGFDWTDIVPAPIRLDFLRSLVTEFDVRDRLSEIQVPTLVLVGESDALLPGALGLQHRIPGARLITYPETGHMIPVEREEEMHRDVAAFLDEIGI